MMKDTADSDEQQAASAPGIQATSSITSSSDGQPPSSRVEAIWNHYTDQLDRIDRLEEQLNERVVRTRRRIANSLDQTPSYRRSHVRLSVTHTCSNTSSVNSTAPNANNPSAPPPAPVATAPPTWTLVVEGKLLIGMLDHSNAERENLEGSWGTAKSGSPSSPRAAVIRTDLKEPARSKDYRTVGEREEDPIDPTLFTHLFDKMKIKFQTIYQPNRPPPAPVALSPPKKSRSTKRKQVDKTPAVPEEAPINPKDLRTTDFVVMDWKKESTTDAHAFWAHYTPPPAAHVPPGMKFHSVVATILLHPTQLEPLYTLAPAFAEQLFPNAPNLIKTAKRQKTSIHPGGGLPQQPGGAPPPHSLHPPVGPTIPLENDIQAPALLTLSEILMALFTYIHDRKLQDPNDKSLIVCDKKLRDLLEVESIPFSQLRQWITTKNLIVRAMDTEPIVLTYCMKRNNISSQQPASGAASSPANTNTQGSILSFDTDVFVPSFFHFRTRELLRRIKRREFEYTSSRTKARYLLVSSRGNEERVKEKIDECVSGRGFDAKNVAVFLALAKAAPPHSESRRAAQIDAKTCALLQKVEECNHQVGTSWDLVSACSALSGRKVADDDK